MSRIVVFEVPDKSDVTMRDMLMKLKELDSTIEARVTMPFKDWMQIMIRDNEGYEMCCTRPGVDSEKLTEFVKKARITSIEEREPEQKSGKECEKCLYYEGVFCNAPEVSVLSFFRHTYREKEEYCGFEGKYWKAKVGNTGSNTHLCEAMK